MANDGTTMAPHSAASADAAGDRVKSGQPITTALFEELAEILADALVADVESEQRESVA